MKTDVSELWKIWKMRGIADLGFLLLCEIIFDVERLPDLFRGFAFDHVGHSLAGYIQQPFNVQVVGGLSGRSAHESVSRSSGTHTKTG